MNTRASNRIRSARVPIYAAFVLLAACSSPPKKFYQGDGPPDARDVPANLAVTPDAVPRVEPFHAWANRPYSALGRTYTPMTTDAPFKQRGMASWYGKQFHGNKTAMGERYDMFAMSAAHPTLPLPSYARVTNTKTGKQIVVRVNDRGPFLHGRVIDLSYAAAVKLGVAGGVAEVEVERITHADIQAGRGAVSSAPPRTIAAVNVTAVNLAAGSTFAPAALSGGRWAVQLGAFEVAANADALRDRAALLLAAPEAADLPDAARAPRVQRDGGLYRVLIGAMPDRATAARLGERIENLLGRDTALYLQP
jgi:rare lipoprotein A